MPWKWYDSKLIKVADQSPTTKRFWVELPPDADIEFKAGQFVTMDLPIAEKRLKRWRSYSIANGPDETKVLEFCIVELEGGAASKYLFKEIEIGNTIRFKGPSGGFVLPETIESDLVFICTGTGVAPFRSMLLDIYESQKAHKNIHLIFGTRYEDGLLYRAEFEALAKKHPEFKYSVALSKAKELPANTATIDYSAGYIHQIYQQHYGKKRSDIDFYLCGWSNMIDEAVENLILEIGYEKGQIHYELYG